MAQLNILLQNYTRMMWKITSKKLAIQTYHIRNWMAGNSSIVSQSHTVIAP
jgi:hypothetical protein